MNIGLTSANATGHIKSKVHMAKKEMTYWYDLAEFLLVSVLQTYADSINWWRVHDTDVGNDKLNEKKMALP